MKCTNNFSLISSEIAFGWFCNMSWVNYISTVLLISSCCMVMLDVGSRMKISVNWMYNGPVIEFLRAYDHSHTLSLPKTELFFFLANHKSNYFFLLKNNVFQILPNVFRGKWQGRCIYCLRNSDQLFVYYKIWWQNYKKMISPASMNVKWSFSNKH